jgi:hypothetical protein
VAVMELYQSLLNYYFGDCFAKTCNQFKPTKKNKTLSVTTKNKKINLEETQYD